MEAAWILKQVYGSPSKELHWEIFSALEQVGAGCFQVLSLVGGLRFLDSNSSHPHFGLFLDPRACFGMGLGYSNQGPPGMVAVLGILPFLGCFRSWDPSFGVHLWCPPLKEGLLNGSFPKHEETWSFRVSHNDP